MGGVPDGIFDVWEALGSDPKTQYTWDRQKNDNLKYPGRYAARLRFDRIYFRHPKEGKNVLKPVSFQFIGTERIPSVERFPSDHWGLLAQFEKVEDE